MNFNSLTYGIREDLVVVGTNSEMADMVNPHGHIHGEAHYIVAEAPDGLRWAHDARAVTSRGSPWRNSLRLERLEFLCERLNAARPIINMDHWTEIDPGYGSEAWQRDGWDAIRLEQERLED